MNKSLTLLLGIMGTLLISSYAQAMRMASGVGQPGLAEEMCQVAHE
jgi:hypothetical protein